MPGFKPSFTTLLCCLLWAGLLSSAPAGSEQSGAVTGLKSVIPNQLQNTASVKITFNDPRLELAVRNALGKPTGDIEDIDMAGLTELHVQNDSIADLSGLEYAINLQKLTMDNNRISAITPLQNLTKLDYISISYNQITDLSPLTNLVNLTLLSLKSNQIAEITPLQNQVNLTWLELQDNPIVDITTLQNLIALKSLYLSDCKITDITALQNLLQLDYLSMTDNKITDITPLQNLTNLTVLRLIDNKITDITPLQNLTALMELSLSRNTISNFSALANLTNMETLYLTETGISDLSVLQNMARLKELHAPNNQIQNLAPVQSLTALKTLICYNNAVTDISGLQNLPALETLDIATNRIDVGALPTLGTLPMLKKLDLSENKLKELATLPVLPLLERLTIQNDQLDHSDLPALYRLDKLKTLYMEDNPGILSGAAVQTLADSLDSADCEDINWDGVCGVEPNAVALCWFEPDTAEINETVTLLATATDANRKKVQVKIDWDDGEMSGYNELQANASLFTFTHVYTSPGKYFIKTSVRNEDGVETASTDYYRLFIVDNGSYVREATAASRGYALEQNYPNPFNATTSIRYSLPGPAPVLLRIYNLAGQETARLLDAVQPSGEYTITWNGTNAAGEILPSGVYIIQIETGAFTRARKMVLLR